MTARTATHDRQPTILLLSLLLLLTTSLVALCVGRYPISPSHVLHALWPIAGSGAASTRRDAADTVRHAIVFDARLPRLIAAALIGAALSVSGAAYQAVFRNPLVSPGMLGVLSGAAFGAAIGIVANAHGYVVQASAFCGGVLAVLAGVGIAHMLRSGALVTLMLGGLISNALFTALLSLIKYAADPLNQLPAIVYWILGSLAQTGWPDVSRFALPLLCGTVLLCLSGRLLDTLTLSDDEARSLGVPVTAIRLGVIVLATLLSALTVSFAGIIGWIGLLVPHLVRPLVGASNTRVLPVAALLGASVLVVADTCARTIAAAEIPLGIVTELLGALAFVLVLRKFRDRLS